MGLWAHHDRAQYTETVSVRRQVHVLMYRGLFVAVLQFEPGESTIQVQAGKVCPDYRWTCVRFAKDKAAFSSHPAIQTMITQGIQHSPTQRHRDSIWVVVTL